MDHGRTVWPSIRTPAALKLDLLCCGLRLGARCQHSALRDRIVRNRAGLASGLDVVLPGGLVVNAAFVEPHCQESPYVLDLSGQPRLVHEDCPEEMISVRLEPTPVWYGLCTQSGLPMRDVASKQGSYLAVYWGDRCANWTRKEQCHFCTQGCNWGAADAINKQAADVLETIDVARRCQHLTFVHINAGFDDAGRDVEHDLALIRQIKRRGLYVGYQVPPIADTEVYRQLKAAGVDNLSICPEFFSDAAFKRWCPGKERREGRDRFYQAMTVAAGEVGFKTVNGEIIAGLEPIDETIAGVRWMCERGIVPTVCAFRPLRGSLLQDAPAPSPAALLPAFRELYRCCMQAGLPIGVAPGIRVAIVMTPDEAAGLQGPRAAWPVQRAALAARRLAALADSRCRRWMARPRV
ncbi:MAG: hypothetical protein PF961_08020 [Planctomycetota bacterium]|jgi:hypothetical protein|nr:hypothetical protein [Planctomycetota bacterium]